MCRHHAKAGLSGHGIVPEGKVYDGGSRGVSHVAQGIPQAARYADDWGEPVAHCLVYNIARDTVLVFVGAEEMGDSWVTSEFGRDVRMLAINLMIDSRASQAHQLKMVRVPVKSLSSEPSAK